MKNEKVEFLTKLKVPTIQHIYLQNFWIQGKTWWNSEVYFSNNQWIPLSCGNNLEE